MKKGSFVRIVESVRSLSGIVTKLEDALGGFCWEEFSAALSPTLDALEIDSGKIFSDQIWDAIFDAQIPAEEVCNMIEELDDSDATSTVTL